MEILREKKKDCIFVFFSDDIEWVKPYFKNVENAVFFDEKTGIYDVEDGCHCLIGSIIRNKKKVEAMTWVAAGSLIE